MRILLYSRGFAPAIGGTERLTQVLAGEFARLGHRITVVTDTPGEANLPYPVERAPPGRRFLELARQCDVILSAQISLRRLPWQLLSGRPIVVIHGIPYTDREYRPSTLAKRLAAHWLTEVVPSRFMARHFPNARIIHNPYDNVLFADASAGSDRDGVLFVGRLDWDKGCDLLLEAFAQTPVAADQRLCIVGGGPELDRLKALAERLALSGRVEFRGELHGQALAAAMREHRIMVVPTRCEEAFGIVALEGLASGCRMIVAESGGLPEAMGSLALSFPRGDVAALAARLGQALGPDDRPPGSAECTAHLQRFSPQRIAGDYLAVMQAAIDAA